MDHWADVVQKNIHPAYLAQMKEKDERTSLLIDVHRLLHQKGTILVNERGMEGNIISRERTYNGKSGEKQFYRKKKVPQKKNKNYPTKPKDNSKINDIMEKAMYNRSVVYGD